MLRAARAKSSSTAAPSMISTDSQPSASRRARSALVLASPIFAFVDDDQLAFGLLRRQRRLEAELAHLLLQVEFVAAHHRAEITAPPRNCGERRLPWRAGRCPSALGLLRRAADVADALGLVRAGAALGELPVDDAGQDVRRTGSPNTSSASSISPTSWLSRLRTVSFMARPPRCRLGAGPRPALRRLSASPGPRSAAPPGRAARQAPSLHRVLDQHPAFFRTRHRPLIRRMPRSASAPTTSRLCVVTRSLPIWPAIFLFLKVLPGPAAARSNPGCGATPRRRGWRASR